jgi:hypothetical protein
VAVCDEKRNIAAVSHHDCLMEGSSEQRLDKVSDVGKGIFSFQQPDNTGTCLNISVHGRIGKAWRMIQAQSLGLNPKAVDFQEISPLFVALYTKGYIWLDNYALAT